MCLLSVKSCFTSGNPREIFATSSKEVDVEEGNSVLIPDPRFSDRGIRLGWKVRERERSRERESQ